MDPAIIGYSKDNNAYSHTLNDTEFGAYFIGSNKENKDTSNNNTDNINVADLEQDNEDNIDANNLHLSLDPQNDFADENNRALTPLNGDTKLAFCGKEAWTSKQNQTRLYELPKKKALDAASDIKSLPSLPATPSPPRMIRNKRALAMKYHAVEPLNDSHDYSDSKYRYLDSKQTKTVANKYYFDDETDRYYGYSQSSKNYRDRYQHDEQQWYKNKRVQNHSYYANNDKYYDNYYGSSTATNDNTSMYPHYSNSYRGNDRNSGASQRSNYSKYAQKAPRFQMQTDTRHMHQSHNGRNLCKWWAKSAVCKNGSECPWSHCSAYDDIRKRVTNYKTKPCVDPGRGLKCEYGDRCNFAHPGEALRRPMPIEYSDRQYFKLLLRDCPTNRYPFGIFV